ncbi:ChaN family lipoprotein [Syntrophobacter fumaroxidans]|uniref:PDZ domain-containing protein n=1 Tax=Syntrophobacter fumaroxidans (strain DSM 10017 / MPOB) TaxID=335543 RepID=A0LLV8_SYNFM|nr:ChaN family lipoprotein [Syntrophobacter fumaroxidans]ABK18410.1 protein of unknown function DUF399 [Syntrophobacter fumaroxidans MPOB]
MHHFYSRALAVWLSLLVLAGCSTLEPKRGTATMEPPASFKVGDIVETKTGKTLPVHALMEQLARARIVYVGEAHTSIEDHRVQLELFKRLSAANPHLCLAMEMFPRTAQPILDKYGAGELSRELLLKETRWEKVWGHPFRLYEAIVEAARSANVRIVGLNAPPDVVSKIARGGIASLSPEERSNVARDFHLDEPGNRLRLHGEYVRHIRGEIKDFETFYEAQLAWEETMAQTLAETLRTLPREGQIVVLIGKGHMTKRLGVPYLTAKRAEHPHRTVAPLPFDHLGSVVDPDVADYVWITDKADSSHKGRLGLMVRTLDDGRGLEVLSVVAGSIAELAGILKGDVIFMIDSVPVKSLDDLHRAMAREGTGNHRIFIRRGKREMSVPLPAGP